MYKITKYALALGVCTLSGNLPLLAAAPKSQDECYKARREILARADTSSIANDPATRGRFSELSNLSNRACIAGNFAESATHLAALEKMIADYKPSTPEELDKRHQAKAQDNIARAKRETERKKAPRVNASLQDVAQGKFVPKTLTDCDAVFQLVVEEARKRNVSQDIGTKIEESARQADAACRANQLADAAKLMANMAQLVSQQPVRERSAFQKEMLDKVAKRRAEHEAEQKSGKKQ